MDKENLDPLTENVSDGFSLPWVKRSRTVSPASPSEETPADDDLPLSSPAGLKSQTQNLLVQTIRSVSCGSEPFV